MDAEDAQEFGCAVLDPATGSTHAGGSRVLTQRQKGGGEMCVHKSVCAVIQSMQMEYNWLNILHPSVRS